MADVTKIFKPRRGKKSTMAGTKATTVLSAGELFVEVPDTGAGTGHSMIKMGDGTTAYSSLPYAIGDTSNDTITFTSDASTTATAALNNVVSGAALKTLIAGLKQAVSLNASSISTLNDEYTSISNSFQTGCSTIASAITSNGVDTASNASPSTMSTNITTACNNKYNAGITYADGRVNTNSASYNAKTLHIANLGTASLGTSSFTLPISGLTADNIYFRVNRASCHALAQDSYVTMGSSAGAVTISVSGTTCTVTVPSGANTHDGWGRGTGPNGDNNGISSLYVTVTVYCIYAQ
jgi:hypothetical protein